MVNYVDATEVNDLYAVVRDVNESFGSWEHNTDFIKRKYIPNRANSIIFDVAERDLTPVGYVIVRKETFDTKAAYLSFLAVHKVHQLGGIGSQILQDTIEKVKSASYERLNLDCFEKNLGFYTKFAEKQKIECSHTLVRESDKKYQVTFNLTTKSPDLDEKKL